MCSSWCVNVDRWSGAARLSRTMCVLWVRSVRALPWRRSSRGTLPSWTPLRQRGASASWTAIGHRCVRRSSPQNNVKIISFLVFPYILLEQLFQSCGWFLFYFCNGFSGRSTYLRGDGSPQPLLFAVLSYLPEAFNKPMIAGSNPIITMIMIRTLSAPYRRVPKTM